MARRKENSAWAVVVTRNLPPLLGGMEKVNRYLVESLKAQYTVAVCGPEGCSASISDAVVSESKVKPLAVFLLGSLLHTLRAGFRHRPAVVLAGSGLTAPAAWLAARLAGAKAVVYLHGLDVVVPNRVYQTLWLPFIRRCDLVLANSAHTASLAIDRGVDADTVKILNPGVTLPALNEEEATHFRARYDLGASPLLLSVGRLTQRKGLAEFVAQSFPRILSERPGTLLLIIGEDANDALHSRGGSERARIVAAAREAGVDAHLRFLGGCDDATLRAAFQACDLHVFPVLDLPGDVEGFGMVALEAAAHGLPTLAFRVGGVPDAIEDGVTGALLPSGDYAAFGEAALDLLNAPRTPKRLAACRAFAADKIWPLFGERLRRWLAEAVSR
jgi:phosphatidylinositol alpha-1,6-mannosyltransferase